MPDASEQIGQAEIDELLRQAQPGAVAAAPEAARGSGAAGSDVEFLLAQAQEALASVDQPTPSPLEGIAPFQFQDFAGSAPSSEKATLELLRDVELDLKIELGRTQMHLEEV